MRVFQISSTLQIKVINNIFLFFNSLNSEFSLGFRLVHIFSSRFLFHWTNCKDKYSKFAYLYNLDNIVFNTLSCFNLIIVVSDINIRNNIAISITYIYLYFNPIKKILIMLLALFSLRPNSLLLSVILIKLSKFEVSYIMVITDSIYVVN